MYIHIYTIYKGRNGKIRNSIKIMENIGWKIRSMFIVMQKKHFFIIFWVFFILHFFFLSSSPKLLFIIISPYSQFPSSQNKMYKRTIFFFCYPASNQTSQPEEGKMGFNFSLILSSYYQVQFIWTITKSFCTSPSHSHHNIIVNFYRIFTKTNSIFYWLVGRLNCWLGVHI